VYFLRWVKRAHAVFAVLEIHARLAADRGVGHRKKARGDELQFRAAHVQRCGKRRHICYYASSDPHE